MVMWFQVGVHILIVFPHLRFFNSTYQKPWRRFQHHLSVEEEAGSHRADCLPFFLPPPPPSPLSPPLTSPKIYLQINRLATGDLAKSSRSNLLRTPLVASVVCWLVGDSSGDCGYPLNAIAIVQIFAWVDKQFLSFFFLSSSSRLLLFAVWVGWCINQYQMLDHLLRPGLLMDAAA